MDGLVTFANDFLWLIIALPLLGVLVNNFFGSRMPEPLPGWIATLASGSAFFVAAIASIPWMFGGEDHAVTLTLWEWMPSLGATLEMRWDPLSIAMTLLVTGVGSLIHLYSIGYIHGDPRQRRYFVYLNLFAASMLTLVLANNFAMVFLGWEMVGLCSYLLISFWRAEDIPAEAGKKAFVVNRIGDFGFIVALMLVFGAFGTMTFDTVLHEPGTTLAAGTATAIGLLFLVAAAGKSAQVPLYVWLPDAMAGPTPASALIHAATMVTAGVYLVARTASIYALTEAALIAVAVVGTLTALWAALIAIGQNDIKKVLAYSTVSQLGYMFLAVGSEAHVAGIFHLLTHAFFKALLFLGAGSVIHGMHEEQDMRKMGGLLKKMPITGWTMAVATVAIAGLPPLAGFWSKDEILASAFERGGIYTVLFAVALFTALLTAIYMTRWFVMVFLGEPRWEEGVEPHESPRVMTLPLIGLAGLSIVGGFMNTPFWLGLEHFLEPAFEGVKLQHPPEGDLKYVLIGVSIAVAALGVVLGWLVYARGDERRDSVLRPFAGFLRGSEAAFGVDEAYSRTIVRGSEAGAGLMARFDSGVVDGAVNGVAWLVRRGGDLLRPVQSGYVRNYSAMLLAGAIGLIVWFVSRGI